MQTLSTGVNLHGMSKPVFGKKNKKSISICHLLKILPRVPSVKVIYIKKFQEKIIVTDINKV